MAGITKFDDFSSAARTITNSTEEKSITPKMVGGLFTNIIDGCESNGNPFIYGDGCYTVGYYEGGERIFAPGDTDFGAYSPIGVLMHYDDRSLIVSLEEPESGDNLYWSRNTDEQCGVIYDNSNLARQDFNGKFNTDAAFLKFGNWENNAENTYAIAYAMKYSCGGRGPGQWYLPSCGELYFMYEHFDELRDAIDMCLGYASLDNFHSIDQDWYWSSSESGSSRAWPVRLYDGYVYAGGKGDRILRVRLVSAFHPV